MLVIFVLLTTGVNSAQNPLSPSALTSHSSLEDRAEYWPGQTSSRAEVSKPSIASQITGGGLYAEKIHWAYLSQVHEHPCAMIIIIIKTACSPVQVSESCT